MMKKCVLVISSYPEFIPDLRKALDTILHKEGWDFIVVTNCGFTHDSDRVVVKDKTFRYWNEAFYQFMNDSDYDVISFLDDDDTFEPNKLERMDQLMTVHSYVHNFARYSNPTYNYNRIDNNTSCITVKTEHIDIEMFKKTRYLNDMLLYLNFVGKKGVINWPEYLTKIRLKPFTNYAEFKQYLGGRYTGRQEDLEMIKRDFSLNRDQERVVDQQIQKYKFMFRNYTMSDMIHSAFSFDKHVYKALLDRKKGLDYFIQEEYNKRYGVTH